MSRDQHEQFGIHIKTDGSDSGAGSISLSSQGSGRMSSLRDLTLSPTPHSISGISLNSSGPVIAKSARLARSPVTVKSVPSKIHDVSDGIRPATTKAYEKNISCCKDYLAEENKDDYTRWVNYFEPNLIKEDIVTELADGAKLITLVNTLTGEKLVPEKGISLHHQTLNVEKVFNCLEEKFHVDVKHLSASDVVRGRREATLALIWTLILNFSDGQIQDFDGLKAFLLQAESSQNEYDVTQRMLASHHNDDGVKKLPHSPSNADASSHQASESSSFLPNKVSTSYHAKPHDGAEKQLRPPDLTDSVTSSSTMEYITPDTQSFNPTVRLHESKTRQPLKPILKPTPRIVLPDEPAKLTESWRGKTARQRMYEVKERSRAVLLKTQVQSQQTSSFKKRKERSASPKQIEDQNRNLHSVHPVDELVLESDQTSKNGSLISSLWSLSSARNALRVVVPLQIMMLIVVGMTFMVPNMDDISCYDCLLENNYVKEFGPVFYHAFPPAV